MDHSGHIISLTIRVKGLVQGVGFRPFVYRLAQEHHLTGWVINGTDGVTVKVEGQARNMAPFIEDLRFKAPVVSQVEEIVVDQDFPEGLQGFYIMASQDLTSETSEISPDIAVCSECIADLKNQPHRTDYPFINCTNCGPRFSIITDFPYDRQKTTMAPFVMCNHCDGEYSEISDRRFHAQPIACNHCGPVYSMLTEDKTISEFSNILEKTSEIINNGGILALKGTGGFYLMCNAMDTNAVKRLREIKRRDGKPFAVMFRDLNSIEEYADVSEIENSSLLSWRRPIVILNARKPLSYDVTMGLNTLGAFLPYMPFHYLLFEKLTMNALVLTSGNFSEEPIIIDNEQALKSFSGVTDAVITYNRDIYNRTDDSVVRVIAEKERVQRRSRGYAPAPIRLDFDVDGIIATGSELSNSFCIGKNNRAYMSQHIGDLKNYETFSFYEEAITRYQQIFRLKPLLMAADKHPDYLSTRYAHQSGLQTIHVQHHHAHIASCMAENGLDETVIGVAFDGTGYGTDGNIWGSEFLVCDYEGFKRSCHFDYMPMPGGDKASEEPWRMGISVLYQAYGIQLADLKLPFIQSLKKPDLFKVVESIQKKINCPLSSGAGRLFDAVAAITGICIHSSFHAEAPMRLESAIESNIHDHYDYDLANTISFTPAIRQIVSDVISGTPPDVIAARFHNTIAEASLEAVIRISNNNGIRKVILSGGSFQNKYLLETLESMLVKNNFEVYTHTKVPCNDGGIALGQIAIAARKNNLKIG